MENTDFSSLGLHELLLNNLSSLGYREMTPIQAQSLPCIVSGNDVIAQGKTGSGKTAAFGLGVLNALNVKAFRIQALVLCPTRELADQVAKELRRLARAIHNIKILTLCGGMPYGPQKGSLEHGAHIIVGTPGRVEEHVRKGNLSLSHLNTFVLDEADRMLEMGFQAALDAIVEQMPERRQTLLFSATFPKEIEQVSKRIMCDPTMVKVESLHTASSIKQHFYQVLDNQHRLLALQLLLLQHKPESTVVFCNTKRETQEVADSLRTQGFSAVALHGDLDQRVRDQTLVCFANKSASVLVATDVAARGLDIDSLDAVINFHLSRESDVHVHRIGRTGRAGEEGIACTLYSEKELYKLIKLQEHLSVDIHDEPLPNDSVLNEASFKPAMSTIQIGGGKKQKLRPGDIVGALTRNQTLKSDDIGKIHVFDHCSYVAIRRNLVNKALKKITEEKLKGRAFRARKVKC